VAANAADRREDVEAVDEKPQLKCTGAQLRRRIHDCRGERQLAGSEQLGGKGLLVMRTQSHDSRGLGWGEPCAYTGSESQCGENTDEGALIQ